MMKHILLEESCDEKCSRDHWRAGRLGVAPSGDLTEVWHTDLNGSAPPGGGRYKEGASG